MRLKLPHIPRLFSATILPGTTTLALWAFLIGLVSLNIVATLRKPVAEKTLLLNVFAKPFSAPAHERLALTLWDNGARRQATKELQLAAELTQNSRSESSTHVLGTSTTPSDLLQTWEQVPIHEAEQLAYWQTVAAAHPDYRDAFIEMAVISYAQGNLTGAKTYLTEASALDPNSTGIHDLLGFVTKQLER